MYYNPLKNIKCAKRKITLKVIVVSFNMEKICERQQPVGTDDGGEGSNHMQGEPKEHVSKELRQESVESGWSWVVLAGSFFTQFMIGGCMRIGGLIFLKLDEKFHASTVTTVWVISLAVTFRMLFGPLASVLSNRFSYRVVVCLGGVLICSGFFLSGFPNQIWPLYLTYSLLGGVGRAFIYTPAVVIVGQYFDQRRGMAVGIGHAGLGTGVLVLSTLIEPIFDHFHFTGAFMILGGIALQTVVCGSLFRPLDMHRRILNYDRRLRLQKQSADEEEMVQILRGDGRREYEIHVSHNGNSSNVKLDTNSNASISSLMLQEKLDISMDISSKQTHIKESGKRLLDIALLKNIRFVLYCISFLLFSFSFQATILLLPPYAKTKGLTEMEAAYLLSIPGATEIIGSVLGGMLLDRKSIRPHSLVIYNVILYLYACLTVLMVVFDKFIPLLCVCALYGMLLGVSSGHRATMLATLVGVENLISSFGILSLFQGFGVLIGPPIAGLLRDVYGRYDESFYCGFAVFILAGITQNFGILSKCLCPKCIKT